MRARPLLIAVLLIFALAPRPSAGRSPIPDGRPSFARSPSAIDNNDRMDANNLDMVVTNHGALAYDLSTGNGGLVYPKGSWKTAIFAAGLWVGAIVGGELRVAVAEYAQDFVPGPMADSTFLPDRPEFRNYKIVRGNTTSDDYIHWPVSQGAPLDQNGNPLLLGDVTIWSVYNDADPAIHTTQAGRTLPLGIEIQQTVFAFNRSGPLGDMIFFRWKLINKGRDTLDSAYVSLWSDVDLGSSGDDFVGCDTTLALGYCYNADNDDAVYGTQPPAIGFQLLEGPTLQQGSVQDTLGMTSFNKYIGGTDPASAQESYFLMQGLGMQGQPVHVFNDPSQPITTFSVSGLDPSAPSSLSNWLDINPADRRLMVSSGPFTMGLGTQQEIRAVLIVGQGTDRLSSIADLRAKAAIAETLDVFDPAPQAPQLSASMEITPNAILLGDDTSWMTAYIESDAFRPEDVQPASVRLAGVAADPKRAVVGDHDGDGRPDLRLVFSGAALKPLLHPGVNYLTLTGSLYSGASFQGSVEVRVISAPSVAPNPLRSFGYLRFETATLGAVRLRIFDATGRLVQSSELGVLPAGQHLSPVENQKGWRTGIYFFRLETADLTSTGRYVVLK
jgi:hypothetical protein